MQLIKDKWYSYKMENINKEYFIYFIFDKLVENRIYHYGYYISNGKEQESGYGHNSYFPLDNNITEIDPSIILDYLSDNNPYKKSYNRHKKIQFLLNEKNELNINK